MIYNYIPWYYYTKYYRIKYYGTKHHNWNYRNNIWSINTSAPRITDKNTQYFTQSWMQLISPLASDQFELSLGKMILPYKIMNTFQWEAFQLLHAPIFNTWRIKSLSHDTLIVWWIRASFISRNKHLFTTQFSCTGIF